MADNLSRLPEMSQALWAEYGEEETASGMNSASAGSSNKH
jgi:hypothetical protein